MSEQQFGPLADRYARQFGVPPRLFRLLIRAESSWNPNAVSHAGARGLTQVVPKWHPNANLSTPQGQLEYGAKHLGSLLKKYGNPRDALSVYNSGRPWSQGQGISETRNYVTKILGQFGSSAPQSGGAAPADAGAVPPAAPVSLPPPPQDVAAGQLDAKKLLKLLRGQTERSLQGIMPTQNFRSTLMDLAEESLPRAQTYVAGKTVGAVAATAAPVVRQAAGRPKAKGRFTPILPSTPQWGSYGYSDPEGQGGKHLAVDWFSPAGTPVRAPADATVVRISADPNPGQKASGQVFGGVLGLRLPDGRLIVMRHITPGNFRVGQRVKAGMPVGTVKDWTGSPHVHLEAYKAGSGDREYRPQYAINPRDLFA